MFLDYLVLGAGAGKFNNGDILATLVIFLALMFILKKSLGVRLWASCKEREELVASEIEAPEKARKESHQFLEEQKSLLKEARTEAQSIVEGAKKQGELQKEEILTVL